MLLSECALGRFKLGRLSQATICAKDLMEHCRKELMPAYLPKLIVVLDAGPHLQQRDTAQRSLDQVCRCFPTAR